MHYFAAMRRRDILLNVDWSLKTEIFVFSTGFTSLSVLLLFPLSTTVLFFVPFLMLFLKQEKGNFDGDQWSKPNIQVATRLLIQKTL